MSITGHLVIPGNVDNLITAVRMTFIWLCMAFHYAECVSNSYP